MALPAIADVHRAWPQVSIVVAARPAVAPLFTMVPGVANVLSLERAGTTPIAMLRDGSFDAALLLPNSLHSAWSIWRAGVRERWGYATDMRRGFLTRAVRRPRSIHQAKYYQWLTERLGFAPGPLEPRIEVAPSIKDSAANLLRQEGWSGSAPLVALSPGAAYGGAKRWPARRFADLAHQLLRRGVQVVLVGGRGDARSGAEVVSALDRTARVLNVIGRTDLQTLAGVLGYCGVMVTNDSGGMHLAAALGLRTVALFGPTNEIETRPLGSVPAIIVRNPVWCRPCMLRECPIDHRCMRGITVDTVLRAME